MRAPPPHSWRKFPLPSNLSTIYISAPSFFRLMCYSLNAWNSEIGLIFGWHDASGLSQWRRVKVVKWQYKLKKNQVKISCWKLNFSQDFLQLRTGDVFFFLICEVKYSIFCLIVPSSEIKRKFKQKTWTFFNRLKMRWNNVLKWFESIC